MRFRDIPLEHDPLLLDTWSKASGMVVDRALAAGLPAPAGLPACATRRAAPSAALLAAIVDGAAGVAAAYVDYDALLRLEADIGGTVEYGIQDSPLFGVRVSMTGGSPNHREVDLGYGFLDSVRVCATHPVAPAPPPGTPLRSEAVRLALASVVDAMGACRHIFAPPGSFRGGMGLRWARQVTLATDGGDVAGDWTIEINAPSSDGCASPESWLGLVGSGGSAVTDWQWDGIVIELLQPGQAPTPQYYTPGRTERYIGPLLYAASAAGYPRMYLDADVGHSQVVTRRYVDDPQTGWTTTYERGEVRDAVSGLVLVCGPMYLVPVNPRADRTLWHLRSPGHDDPYHDNELDTLGLGAAGATWIASNARQGWPTLSVLRNLSLPSAMRGLTYVPSPTQCLGGLYAEGFPAHADIAFAPDHRLSAGWRADLALLEIAPPA